MHTAFGRDIPPADTVDGRGIAPFDLFIEAMAAELSAIPTHRLNACYQAAADRHEGQFPLSINELRQAWRMVQQANAPERKAIPAGITAERIGPICPGGQCVGDGWVAIRYRLRGQQEIHDGVHPCQCTQAIQTPWTMLPGAMVVGWFNPKHGWEEVTR